MLCPGTTWLNEFCASIVWTETWSFCKVDIRISSSFWYQKTRIRIPFLLAVFNLMNSMLDRRARNRLENHVSRYAENKCSSLVQFSNLYYWKTGLILNMPWIRSTVLTYSTARCISLLRTLKSIKSNWVKFVSFPTLPLRNVETLSPWRRNVTHFLRFPWNADSALKSRGAAAVPVQNKVNQSTSLLSVIHQMC